MMALDSFDVVNGDVRIRIQGLGRTTRALAKAGVASESQAALMHSIGMIVVHAANPPVLSGRLAGTIRAGRGKTKAVVRAGGARAPYAGVVHYGNPHRNATAQPFLTEALNRKRSDVFQALNDGVEAILKQNQLK